MNYIKVKGRMKEVWAKCICPVCDLDLEHLCDDYNKDDDGKTWHEDTYSCNHCEIFVVYVAPADIHEYHLVPDKDRFYMIENMWQIRELLQNGESD